MNILVFLISGIGDHIYTSVMLSALKEAHPEGKLIVFTKNQSLDLFNNCKAIDQVICITHKGKKRSKGFEISKIMEIRKAKIDVAYVLHNKNRSLIYALLGGCKKIIAISTGQPTRFARIVASQTIVIPWDFSKQHAVDYARAVAQSICGIDPGHKIWIGAVDSQDDVRAENWIDEFRRLQPECETVMAICMGVEGTARLWGVEKCAELLSKLVLDKKYTVYFVGAACDWTYSQSIIDAAGVQAFNLCGKNSLNVSRALFKLTDIMLSLDTGPAHLAGATCGVPVAVIAKTADPRVWHVIGDCYIPVHEFGAPTYNPDADISVADVELALEGLIYFKKNRQQLHFANNGLNIL